MYYIKSKFFGETEPIRFMCSMEKGREGDREGGTEREGERRRQGQSQRQRQRERVYFKELGLMTMKSVKSKNLKVGQKGKDPVRADIVVGVQKQSAGQTPSSSGKLTFS